MDELPLSGGNVTAGVVRVGDTVRRPVGAWTPAVHNLLQHLEQQASAARRGRSVSMRRAARCLHLRPGRSGLAVGGVPAADD